MSGLVYWAAMLVNARRVRRRIGRSPNLKPRGAKERLLFALWLAVIGVWIAQPAVMYAGPGLWLVRPLVDGGWGALAGGVLAILVGQAGTFWCYRAMGEHWRIGVRPKERTQLVQRGPYAAVRHPIYSFQMLILAGVAVLLPTVLSLAMLAVHGAGYWAKSADEETYLLGLHPQEYADYRRRTGRFIPGLGRRAARGRNT